ncbi:MFS transporter [Methanothermobacter sp. K4]|uniref:MFS transporter n=1 Tax=Methanothermobacter sp. K4 TaxID=2913262 RepID=UPI001EDBB378|nr:MFS transporter [Methanothermobacter sp. K4]MCG2829106.1 MFS transporter [Methanothermobacter sp. K4]
MKDDHLKVYVLSAVTLSSFLAPFMGSSINVALPLIGESLNMGPSQQTWIIMAFLLTANIFLLPFGRLSELYGIKRLFISGNIIFITASLLCALAPDATSIILFRAFQGIGASMVLVTRLSLISMVFPASERGRAIGVNTAAIDMGLFAGPILGGFLAEILGWESIFLFTVPLGILVILISLSRVDDEWMVSGNEKFDFEGSLTYCTFLFLFIQGFSTLASIRGLLLLVLSFLAFSLFIKTETQAKNPLFNFKLFKNRKFAFSSLEALLVFTSTFAVSLLLSYHLQYVRGLSPSASGIILIVQPLMMAMIAPLAGRMADMVKPHILTSAGMLLIFTALMGFATLGPDTPETAVIMGLMLLGTGMGLFSSPNTTKIMCSVKRDQAGMASATVTSMRLIGQAFSMGIVTLIFAFLIGSVSASPSNYGLLMESTRICFLLFGIICFIGLFATTTYRNSD